MDDFVTRYGKNVDVVLTAIATSLISPTAAVVVALLGALYISGKDRKSPLYRMPKDDYLRLKEVVYKSIISHNDGVKRNLVDYGINPVDADILLHRVAYDNYLDGIIATYA